MTAIYGYNFCAGAIKSFALIVANIARAAVLDQVTNLVLFMGKVNMDHFVKLRQGSGKDWQGMAVKAKGLKA